MSVTDPLIKDIKGYTIRLFNESTPEKIGDSNKNLQNFCHVLEKIFHRGLIESHSFFGSKQIEPFTWMSSVPVGGDDLADFNYQNCVEEVQNCKNVNTLLGKFRLLIRHCIMKKCLHFPVESVNKSQVFYEKNSILGDEILSTILVSVLLQCNKINFDLQLCNSSFLDLTWQIPDLMKLELVPCKNLGISVSFSENKAVVVHIKSNSVASECGEISTGDILSNLNGVEINSSCKGRLNSILRLNKGQPINVTIIKAFHKESQDVFQPMKSILRNLQIDIMKISSAKSNDKTNESESSSVLQNIKSGYKATYLGFVNVGNKGSVKQIEEAMKRLLNASSSKSEEKAVIFEIGEMCIRVLDMETSEIIFKHSYMQISSCGSAPNLPNYIAYIAGDDNCDTATDFICYMFYVKSTEDACTILQSIGQGFYRTHFAV